ncbi:hypothetical protein [Acidithiobacillus sp.]|uniref:hypothetical protein n=1 Tax=Acidithiobacillus sp. TaxID=1872118 RepID=UPI0025BB6989|nr:hypothetical protein [Acidithiobacillus sp.]
MIVIAALTNLSQSAANFPDALHSDIKVGGFNRASERLHAGVGLAAFAGLADDVGVHQIHGQLAL